MGPVILTSGSLLAAITWDYQVVTSWDANNPPRPLIQQFFKGGSGGTLQATLTYTWSGSGTGSDFPTSITRVLEAP